MAGRPKGHDIGLAPADKPVGAEYERDFYSWLMEQARHVRDGRWDALDRENLAEEIESLGREQFNKLESALRVLMLHMLKWDHQPAKRSRSWAISIRQQRLELDDVLADNRACGHGSAKQSNAPTAGGPSQAAKETGLSRSFPATCPYSWKDIESRTFAL